MRDMEYLKGHPRIIMPTLITLKKYQDLPRPQNRKEFIKHLKVELPQILRGFSKASGENLSYAQAIPTCQKLNLITKSKTNPYLTAYGFELVEEKDENKFKLKLGKLILDFDEKNCKIIQAIRENQKSPGDFVSFEEIIKTLYIKYGLYVGQRLKDKNSIKRLEGYGIKSSSSSRLVDNLNFYEYVNLVLWKGEKVSLNEGRLNIINNSLDRKSEIETDVFFTALYKEYRSLVKDTGGSPYVPIIPRLRSRVCAELRIDDELFNNKLISLPTIFMGKHILLSPPMKVINNETITKNKKPVYFISIYENGR